MAEQNIILRKDLFVNQNTFSHLGSELKKGATSFLSESMFHLALSYFYGEGYPQDYKKSYELATKAANGNHARAQCLLGFCRANGLGVPQDLSVMLYWFHKSADQKDIGGLFYLAQCYENGWGIPQDLQIALDFYAEAANLGDAISIEKTEELTETIDSANKKYTKEDIEKWYEKGEEHYFGHEGTKPNYKEAIKWYRKAAKVGHADAQFSLGYCYLTGQGVATDEEVACKWLKKAAEQNHVEAIYYLGTCYEQGSGVPIDITQAMNLYNEAEKLGNADAIEAIDHLNKNIAAYKAYFEKVGIIHDAFVIQLTSEERCLYEGLKGSAKAEFEYYRKQHPNWSFKTLYKMSTLVSDKIENSFMDKKETKSTSKDTKPISIPPYNLEELTPAHRAMYEKAKLRHPEWTHEQCLYYGYNLVK